MYFVDDGTKRCGYYECRKCDYRFLSISVSPKTSCPYCEQDIDYEIGPDESLEDYLETAVLKEIVEGEENVERMDILLSAAYVDDEAWL